MALRLEDAAHAIGSKYKGQAVGSIADMTTFSFHPVKTITGGEGGAITTNDETLYNKLKLLRTHGITRDLKKITKTRLQIYNELLAKGIQCNVHYIPVYYHPYYQKLGYKKGICLNAEALYEEILTIPLYYSLTDQDVEYIIQQVKRLFLAQ